MRIRSRKTLQERFWPKVQVSEGCWTWLATKDKDGYGQIGSGGKDGEIMRAHRASWEIHFGPIPDGISVCHKCDKAADMFSPADHLCRPCRKELSRTNRKRKDGRRTAQGRWSI